MEMILPGFADLYNIYEDFMPSCGNSAAVRVLLTRNLVYMKYQTEALI